MTSKQEPAPATDTPDTQPPPQAALTVPAVGAKAPSSAQLPIPNPNAKPTIVTFLRHCGCPCNSYPFSTPPRTRANTLPQLPRNPSATSATLPTATQKRTLLPYPTVPRRRQTSGLSMSAVPGTYRSLSTQSASYTRYGAWAGRVPGTC
jgi:hypothetical protein